MSMQSSNNDQARVTAPLPICPVCQRRMVVRQVSPVLFTSSVDDVLYGCESCGEEFKRSVRRS